MKNIFVSYEWHTKDDEILNNFGYDFILMVDEPRSALDIETMHNIILNRSIYKSDYAVFNIINWKVLEQEVK